MKRLLLTLLLLALSFIGLIIVRTVRLRSLQPPVERATAGQPLPGAAEHLAGAIRIPTISNSDPARRDTQAFAALHGYLASAFPKAHATLCREVLGRDALLYTWPGSELLLATVVLMAHMDVVPVEPASESAWTYAAFSGQIAQGFVWGRGAMDDKVGVLGALEAVEALLTSGFRPRRTEYLAFGVDEEVGGIQGAAQIAALLRARSVRPELVLDEGGSVTDRIVPAVSQPVAVVGIVDKGYLNVQITAHDAGGPSWKPPRWTAAGRVARAAAALEDNPFPARLSGPTDRFFDYPSPEMSGGMRLVMANRWLFEPLILRKLAAAPSSNPGIRTTTAVTILEGSPKENVLASRARAVVNFRLYPGDAIAGVLAHVRRTVDDPTLDIRVIGDRAEASPISSTDSRAWGVLGRTIRQIFPEAVVAPYLGYGSDAEHFAGLSPNVYRFLPVLVRLEDLDRVHRINERIAVESYLRAVRFYAQFLQNAAG